MPVNILGDSSARLSNLLEQCIQYFLSREILEAVIKNTGISRFMQCIVREGTLSDVNRKS